MKPIYGFFLYSIVFINILHADFLSHARGIQAGKFGDLNDAKKILENELIQHPHDETLLYDAAIVDFRLGNYQSAAHYFEEVAQTTEEKNKKIEAYFNAGNAQVYLKNYDYALNMYEKVLALEKDHEKAKHNYEVVKKMKKEQQQEKNKPENKDNSSDQNSDDSDNKNEDNDNPDQSDQSSDLSDEQQENNDQQKNNFDDTSDQQQNKSLPSDGKQNAGNQSQEDTSKTTHNNKQSHHSDVNRNNQRQDNSQTENIEKKYGKSSGQEHKSEADKNVQKQKNSLIAAPSAETSQQENAFGQEKFAPELEGCDKQWMRAALETCDQQDNHHNKQLLKAMVATDKEGNDNVLFSW